MIEEAYVSFETAKLAKEKGFNELCNSDYCKGLINYPHADNEYTNSQISEDGRISRPTQSLLTRWFREKHNMCVEVYFTAYGFVWCICNTNNDEDRYGSGESGPNNAGAWDTYENAKEDGLQEALKLI